MRVVLVRVMQVEPCCWMTYTTHRDRLDDATTLLYILLACRGGVSVWATVSGVKISGVGVKVKVKVRTTVDCGRRPNTGDI